jgi:glutamate dehydrogenase
MFLDESSPAKAYRLETYRSSGAISSTISQQLRCYFVTRCSFPEQVEGQAPVQTAQGTTDIRAVGDASFLEKASENTLDIYQQVMDEVVRREGPVIEMFEVEESRERRLVIGYKWVYLSNRLVHG